MSNKITKQLAKDVAKSMSSSAIQPKRDKLRLELEDLIEPYIIKQIPAQVMDLYLKYPNYLNKTSTYRLHVNGAGEFGFGMSKSYPSNGQYSIALDVSKDSHKKMTKIYNEMQNLRSKQEELKQSIEATLNQLSTFKKISEHFNEAIAFIPVEYLQGTPSTAIAIPIENIRKELSQFKSDKP